MLISSSVVDAATEFLTGESNEDEYFPRIPSILLALLTAWRENGQAAAQDAARRIDANYWDVFLPANPLIMGFEEVATGAFFYGLYGLIFNVVRFIDFDDDRQDAFVQVIIELRKQPPNRPLEHWKVDYLFSVHHCLAADSRSRNTVFLLSRTTCLGER